MTAPGRLWSLARWAWAAFYALSLWRAHVGLVAACLAADLWMFGHYGVRRARFFDVGRFTAGAWPVMEWERPLIFAMAFLRHGPGPDAPRCGLEVVVGRVSLGVFALLPRAEWAEFKAKQKEKTTR
ncbi:hypothetical protein ACIP9H_34030 [Streptomyces sp. NPDC088732]|uniref:hypothetical protein n=1 Tax=Streptomyces sp. NPDC088732 TaxID=3365879 RepID=UPI0037F8D4D5